MTLGRQFRGVERFEYFPVEENLQDTAADRVMFIDIGGGIGHDITELKNRFPQLLGRFILQHLPDVINNIPEPLSNGIETVTYDMFTSHGRRCYIHSSFHRHDRLSYCTDVQHFHVVFHSLC